jgi:hypothetical protein
MHDVGVKPAQHTHHSGAWDAQRKRIDLREHPRRYPVNTDSLMDIVGRRLTPRRVRRNDKGLMTRAAEMLDHPKHRVGNAVDIREEGLCDDCNAHASRVPSAAVGKVSYRDMSYKQLVPMNGFSAWAFSSMVRTEKGG